jgi:hypothetical protein
MGLNFLSWNWLPLLPIFVVYFVSSLAETNRIPFDVIEGEAEIVAGHMVEYSGMSWAMFQMAEYANIWLVSVLATLMFLGGWLPPIHSALFNWIPGWIWLGLKTFCGDLVHLDPVHVPSLPVRPDHASGLEDLHSGHAGVAGGCRCVDADALEHLELIRNAYVHPNTK